jgi:hypothetical protein
MDSEAGRGRGVPCSVTALVTEPCRATGCRFAAGGQLCQLASACTENHFVMPQA